MRRATDSDCARICEIYNYYVQKTAINFDEVPRKPNFVKERIADVIVEYHD